MELFDMDDAVRNIKRVFARANPEEIEEGSNWYPAANSFARGLADKHLYQVWQTAAVIAALSPQITWETNMALAEQVCRTGDCRGTFRANVSKAQDALAGEFRLAGNKVLAFFDNILSPNCDTTVTIDRHAAAIALGYPLSHLERSRALATTARYNSFAEAYKNAATDLKMLPNAVQAITWVRWRNELRDQTGGSDL